MSWGSTTDQRPEISERDYYGIQEAMRASGFGSARLMRLALLGSVQTLILPGRAPLYRKTDVERIASNCDR